MQTIANGRSLIVTMLLCSTSSTLRGGRNPLRRNNLARIPSTGHVVCVAPPSDPKTPLGSRVRGRCV